MNSTGKKIVAKVAAVLAVSGSAFVLTATSATLSPISAVALAEPQVSPPAHRSSSMVNSYTEPTMLDYLNYVRPIVTQFFSDKYNGTMPEPSNYHFIFENRPQQLDCGNKPAGASAYEYCSDDHSIYLGQAYMVASIPR